MSTMDFAAGASAARNKLAAYLRENGINVHPSHWRQPPTDEDFRRSVLTAFTENSDHFKGEHAIVIFKWWQVDYKFAVPFSELEELMNNPKSHYVLFSATS